MPILIFKTDIRYKKDVDAIGSHIAKQPGIVKWNVDLKDADKILRVETAELHPLEIEELVKSAGHSCQELTD